MPGFTSKFRGDGSCPPAPSWRQIARGLIGGSIGIGIVALLTRSYHLPLLMAPLGASCFLLFGAPDAPFAQPRNVVFGHLLSSLVGLLFTRYIGVGPIELGMAVGLAIALMLATRTSHPPAGADPLVVMVAGNLGWNFLLTPVLASTVLLVLVAAVINNIGKDRSWPRYWF
jgi:CBS-domain-containing membrane protein